MSTPWPVMIFLMEAMEVLNAAKLPSNLENQFSHCEDPKCIANINVQVYSHDIYFTPTGEPVFEM